MSTCIIKLVCDRLNKVSVQDDYGDLQPTNRIRKKILF